MHGRVQLKLTTYPRMWFFVFVVYCREAYLQKFDLEEILRLLPKIMIDFSNRELKGADREIKNSRENLIDKICRPIFMRC